MTLSYLNTTKRRLLRPQITQATDDLAIVHLAAADGLRAVTCLQWAGESIYQVTGGKILVWCPDLFGHAQPGKRAAWQRVVAPSYLESDEAIVEWLVAGLAANGAGEVAA